MKLSGDDIEKALFCVNEVIGWRKRNGVPLEKWMPDLGFRFDVASLTSPRGNDLSCGEQELTLPVLIGSGAVADLLGLSTRQVRNLTADLEGEKIGGRLVFKSSVVIEYAEGRKNGRTS